ncbi:MAG: 5'/3'-nucleotidase SurE [Clostridia bacterium]|nr:5'/3'-nucleotidase SurE [Clostridia bacterium]MDD4048308.1 5'/3'-nucleotidase SurE [Clostridia bacterium]
MEILVTNDDGIWATGIQTLASSLKELGEVSIVAPLEEKSAIGHGITIRESIRVQEHKLKGLKSAWAVDGTPADCVKLGVKELVGNDCGLVISGINHGPNLGTDVLYSGTVSAAIEGVIMGLPSIAVSLNSWDYDDYSVAADVTLNLVRYILENKMMLPGRTLLNVNIPPVKKEEILGFRITKLGVREYDNQYEKRLDPKGDTYYWPAGKIIPSKEINPDIDIIAVEQNYISITPIHFDLTNYQIIKEVNKWDLDKLRI